MEGRSSASVSRRPEVAQAAADDGRPLETVFDRFAARYDAWYDGPVGRLAFTPEVDALRPLVASLPGPWLEVGLGTGRFAAALGVPYGIDPSLPALGFARDRGLRVALARGEALPFGNETIGVILLVLTLCFVDDPEAVLREARRVVRPDGGLVLGTILAENPWGRRYRELARQGHLYYQTAHFFHHADVVDLLQRTSWKLVRECSALFQPPTSLLRFEPARDAFDPMVGFTGILARPARGRGER